MTPQPLSTPFSFDTEFDSLGDVVRASSYRPAKRAWTGPEVEALVAQARAEARQIAMDEVESLQAMALSTIGQALAASAPALTLVAQTHREQSAELALACARVMTSAALTRFPTGPLQDALEQLGSEIDASPRLVIRAGGLDEAVKARLQAVCIDAGFSGLIAFRDDPGMALAAFHLEWADGRADFDPAEAAERIGGALAAALAAEAGHAEPLNGSH